MMQIATARINYRGAGLVLNTTVKSGCGLGKQYAPTWAMVMGYKKGRITWVQYTEQYTALMRERYRTDPEQFVRPLHQDHIVLCCYRYVDLKTSPLYCHRFLLKDILLKLAAYQQIDAEYIGDFQ
jgi:hypothetical protein